MNSFDTLAYSLTLSVAIMTPRSFWAIAIKILGISFAYQSITTIWKAISMIIMYASWTELFPEVRAQINGSNYLYGALISSLFIFVVNIIVVFLCIFRTDMVINKLKLEKGFIEERFELNVSRSTVLKIVIIITGALLLLNMTTDLIVEVTDYLLPVEKLSHLRNNRELGYIAEDVLRMVIALCIIIFSSSIVNFVERKSNKKSAISIDTALTTEGE